jgi:hypothetical protein
MGSVAQRRGAYGGEVPSVGLRMRMHSYGEERRQQEEVSARVKGGVHLAAPLLIQ